MSTEHIYQYNKRHLKDCVRTAVQVEGAMTGESTFMPESKSALLKDKLTYEDLVLARQQIDAAVKNLKLSEVTLADATGLIKAKIDEDPEMQKPEVVEMFVKEPHLIRALGVLAVLKQNPAMQCKMGRTLDALKVLLESHDQVKNFGPLINVSFTALGRPVVLPSPSP